MNQVGVDLNDTPFDENGGWSRTRVRAIALALLTAVGIYLCYRLARPCIPSLVWAGALALVFTPLQRWLEARVKRPNLAAAFSLVIIGLLVVAPATWFAQTLAEQVTLVPENIQKQIAAGKWHIHGDQHPQLAHFLALVERQVSSPENASMATTWLKTTLSRLVKESAIAAVQVSLTLYFLFYFLRDRFRVLKAIRSFLPLSENETNTLFCRVNDTIHATLYGMLALSALQGVLGGLMFWWRGGSFTMVLGAGGGAIRIRAGARHICPLAPGSGVSRTGGQVGGSSRRNCPRQSAGPRDRDFPLSGPGERPAEGPHSKYLRRPRGRAAPLWLEWTRARAGHPYSYERSPRNLRKAHR